MEQVNTDLFRLQIDETAISYLSETAKWAKFLSIVGFVFCGLFVLLGIFMGTTMSTVFATSHMGTNSGVVFSVVYVFIAALYFFPCLYMIKFSRFMQVAIKAGDPVQLNEGLKNLKSCFKFMGIFTIILLSLYLLGIVAAGIFTAFMK
jgi:hypothetical protein